MSPQGCLDEKSLFTLGARIWFLPGVHSTVTDQAVGLREGLVIGGAGEGFIPCLCPLVTLQGTRLRESLVTLGAGLRFLSGVGSHVDPQVL